MAKKKSSLLDNLSNALGSTTKKISPDVLKRLLWDVIEHKVVVIKIEKGEITRIQPNTYVPSEHEEGTIEIIKFN